MAKPIRYQPFTPANLPKMVRHEVDVLRAHLAGNQSILTTIPGISADFTNFLDEIQDEILDTINEIAQMELHWFTPDMAAMAMDLSEDYTPATSLNYLLPAPYGIIIWENGIGTWPALTEDEHNNPWSSQTPVPVDGIRWHADQDRLRLAPLFRTEHLQWSPQKPLLNKAFERAFQLQKTSAIAFSVDRFTWPSPEPPPAHVQGLIRVFWASLVVIEQGQDQLTSRHTVTATIPHPHAGHSEKLGKTKTQTVYVIDMLHRQPKPTTKPAPNTDQ